MSDEALVRGLVDAVARSIDGERLRRELSALSPAAAPPAARAEGADVQHEVLRKIVLADVLGEDILAARPGDRAFPLRLFFGELGAHVGEDVAFSLACGLNVYFRAAMEEEPKMRLGLEVSRLYYAFAAARRLEPAQIAQTSPLLAALMSTELPRLRFESVDHASHFDSALHEREDGASAASSAIARPATFLCRIASTGAVRAKARVVT